MRVHFEWNVAVDLQILLIFIANLLDMMSHGKHSQPHGSGSLPRPPLRLVCMGKPSPRLCSGDAIFKRRLWHKLGRMRRREATVRESVVRLIGGTKVGPTERNLTSYFRM